MSALTSKPQARFDGSDRQARGRLLRMLSERGVPRSEVRDVMGVDSARAARLLDSLVRDGLVVVDGDWCRLP
jgi:A/G-specific adenine glycosylase